MFAVLYDDSNVLEHLWCMGDLVVWNNVTVTHARADNSWVEHRTLQRVTLGTKGYFDLYPWLADFDWDAAGSLVALDRIARGPRERRPNPPTVRGIVPHADRG